MNISRKPSLPQTRIIPRMIVFVMLLAPRPWLDAAGIAMLKEQAFHRDAAAKPMVFGKMSDSGASFAIFETAGKRVSVERSKIAAMLHVPDAIPKKITDDVELAPLRKSLMEMQEFTKRFPQTEMLLSKQKEAIAGHIEKFESGHLRIGGEWMTKAEFTALSQQMETKHTALKQQDADRQREKEEFEAGQRAKGLVLFEGRWLEPSEVEAIRKQRVEVLEKLRAVPLPLVVTRDFKAAWPGGGVTSRLIHFKAGQRFALMPAAGGGKFKFQTLRFEDETPVTAYHELPSLSGDVTVDLSTVNGLQPADVTWGITLEPIAEAEGVKRISIKCIPSKPAIPKGHPAAIAMTVERGENSTSGARLVSWQNLAEKDPEPYQATLRSLDQVKQAMTCGVILVNGAGTTTAPAFPKESDFPQMAELAAAVTAYGQFKLNQDLVKSRINSFEMEMKSLSKQESMLSAAISAARLKASNAQSRINASRDLINARAQYHAAKSEIKTNETQLSILRESKNGLWKQIQAAKKELLEIE